MRKIKFYKIDEHDGDESSEYKNFIVVKIQKEELPTKVKYKEILKIEDDFLDEN
jgi:hypothetical protein